MLGGLVFAQRLTDVPSAATAAAAVALFCLVSGGVYLLNDVIDLEKDRQHPVKRLRPLAAGELSVTAAMLAAGTLIAGSVLGAFLLQRTFGLAVAAYVALQLCYAFALKQVVILDVLAIAAGFVLRAVGGAAVIEVPISPWLYVCTVLLALFLALGKRRQELALLEETAHNHRPILAEYTLPLLDHLITIVTTCALLAYMLYTFFAESLPRNHAMMWTIPFTLYGMFRYLYLVHARHEGGSPDVLLLRDRPLLACVALWGVAVVVILYVLR